jgi:hypothetical protein
MTGSKSEKQKCKQYATEFLIAIVVFVGVLVWGETGSSWGFVWLVLAGCLFGLVLNVVKFTRADAAPAK